MIEHIFKLEDVKPGVPKAYQFTENSQVIINDFQLKKDQIAQVEVTKLKDLPDTIFITLYSKFAEIGTVVTKESYVLDLEVVEDVKYYYLDPLKAGEINKIE